MYFLETLRINENRLNKWEKAGVCAGAVLSGLAVDAYLGGAEEPAVFLTMCAVRNYGLAKLVIDHLTTLNQSWAFPPGWRWQVGLISASVLSANLNKIFNICIPLLASVMYYLKSEQNKAEAPVINCPEEDVLPLIQKIQETAPETFKAIADEVDRQMKQVKQAEEDRRAAIAWGSVSGFLGLVLLPRQVVSIAVSGVGGCIGYVVSHGYVTADAASGFFRGAARRAQAACQAVRNRFF